MSVLEVPLEIDAFGVARALAERDAVVLLFLDGPSRALVACDPVDTASTLDPEPSLPIGGAPRIPRWFGLLPYEARRSLERRRVPDPRPEPDLGGSLWRRYRAAVEITSEVRVIGETLQAARELRDLLVAGAERGSPPPAHASVALRGRAEPGRVHAARIERALELIRRGDVYQVNLARSFELDVHGRPVDLLSALTAGGVSRFSAAFDWPELGVVAASPELFLALDASGRVVTSPIKGTRPRDRDPERDRALALELDRDEKERAELAMVIDVERNDLGRVARPGSVRLVEPPRVESHPGVHHRVASVEAALGPELGREALLLATLPSGSVTGAPKVRAMQVIAELEARRRGLYTGAFGVVYADGGLELGMAIRTLTFTGRRGRYFAGGGIVADSVPEREVEETLWKAAALVRACGVPAENWA